MANLRQIYDDHNVDTPFEEFEDLTQEKVDEMGGVVDVEAAGMLVAKELGESQQRAIQDVKLSQSTAVVAGCVVSIGEVRTFKQDEDEEDEESGKVRNAILEDDTGQIRLTFWHSKAADLEEHISEGDCLKVEGRPENGYNGLELHVSEFEVDNSLDIDPSTKTYDIGKLQAGLTNVTIEGEIIWKSDLRTFNRSSGDTGQVRNILIGDSTGHIKMVFWDEDVETADALPLREFIRFENVDIRSGDDSLEVNYGDGYSILSETEIEYRPTVTPLEAITIEESYSVAGTVREYSEKRSFDRDDGSTGHVRNITISDESDKMRVALWGDHADIELNPGDTVLLLDVEAQEGWQDDIELSAGWQSIVIPFDGEVDYQKSSATAGVSNEGQQKSLESVFGNNDEDESNEDAEEENAVEQVADSDSDASNGNENDDQNEKREEFVEIRGQVIQSDNNQATLDTNEGKKEIVINESVGLGQQLTVRCAENDDGNLEAVEVL